MYQKTKRISSSALPTLDQYNSKEVQYVPGVDPEGLMMWGTYSFVRQRQVSLLYTDKYP